MRLTLLRLLAVVPLTLSSSALLAAEVGSTVPEPGVLELAGVGAAVAIAVALTRRRK